MGPILVVEAEEGLVTPPFDYDSDDSENVGRVAGV